MIKSINFSVLSILILFLALVALVITFIYYLKKNKLKLYFMLLTQVIIIFSATIILNNIVPTKSYDNLTYINIKNETPLTDVTLVKSEHNYLYDNSNKEIIGYKDTELRELSPVYLNNLEYYLVVIYSKENEMYKDGKYLSSSNSRKDRLVIISKKTGLITTYRERSYITTRLDLDNATSVSNMVSIPTYDRFENDYSNITNIIPNERLSYAIITNWSYPKKSFYDEETHKYNYIKDFYINKHYATVTITEQGDILYEYQVISFEEHGHSIRRNISDALENQELVKKGYIKTINEEIYFVSNDYKIYKLYRDARIYIKDIENLDDWINEIKDAASLHL